MKIQSPDDVVLQFTSSLIERFYKTTGVNPLVIVIFPFLSALGFGVAMSLYFAFQVNDLSFCFITGLYAGWLSAVWSNSKAIRDDCRREWDSSLFKKYSAMAVARRETTENARFMNLIISFVFLAIFSSPYMTNGLGLSIWECMVFPAVSIFATIRVYSLCCDLPRPNDGDARLAGQNA